MKKLIAIISALSIALLMGVSAYAGNAAGSGRGSGSGYGSSSGGGYGSGSGGGMMDMQGDKSHIKSRSMDRQRNHIRFCTNAAEGIKKMARNMSQYASEGSFNSAKATQMHMRMTRQFRAMKAEHDSMLNSIDNKTNGEAIRVMNRLRTQVQERLDGMGSELSSDKPDPDKVREHARNMEQEMQQWIEQYRKVRANVQEQ